MQFFNDKFRILCYDIRTDIKKEGSLLKLKEENQPQKNVVAENFYLYTEHIQPQKKPRSWLPLWILVAVLWTATALLSFPRMQNYVMGKLLPPEIHYQLLEQKYINGLKNSSINLPLEYTFSLTGTAYDSLLKDFSEKTFTVKNPLDSSALIEAGESFIKNSAGTITRSFDGENPVFTVIFSEDSGLYGAEMSVTADRDGEIFGREFLMDGSRICLRENSDSANREFYFRYENGEEYIEITGNGALMPDGYNGNALVNSSDGTAVVNFEKLSLDENLRGIIRLEMSDISAESVLGGTLQKPAADVTFSNNGEKLVSYTISPAEADSAEELTASGIFDSFKKLAEVEEFSPDEPHNEPEHPCVRSVDLTMSKIKIGKKYIGLPALLENLPVLFELEGEIIEAGQEKLFVTDNREVVIHLKNYNDKSEDAMKCDVTQIIVKGNAGNKLWELKLNGIGIGNTEYQTVSVLGEPSRVEDFDGDTVYCYHDCENDIEFKFKYKNGVIVQTVFAIGK